MKIILIPLLIILNSYAVFSQTTYPSKFKKGKIITYSNTIDCYILKKENYKGRIKYKFSLSEKRTQKIDISMVDQLECGDSYQKIFFKDNFILAKLEVKGFVSLYDYAKKTLNHLYVGGGYNQPSRFVSTPAEDSHNFFLIKNEKVYNLSDKNTFKSEMRKALTGSNEIIERIHRLNYDELHKSLPILIERYNELVKILKIPQKSISQ